MEHIKKKVKNILKEQFDINVDSIESDDISLFSVEIHLDPRELVYFVLYIEKLFDIKFSENDFDNAEFYNLNGFCKIINSYSNSK